MLCSRGRLALWLQTQDWLRIVTALIAILVTGGKHRARVTCRLSHVGLGKEIISGWASGVFAPLRTLQPHVIPSQVRTIPPRHSLALSGMWTLCSFFQCLSGPLHSYEWSPKRDSPGEEFQLCPANDFFSVVFIPEQI